MESYQIRGLSFKLKHRTFNPRNRGKYPEALPTKENGVKVTNHLGKVIHLEIGVSSILTFSTNYYE